MYAIFPATSDVMHVSVLCVYLYMKKYWIKFWYYWSWWEVSHWFQQVKVLISLVCIEEKEVSEPNCLTFSSLELQAVHKHALFDKFLFQNKSPELELCPFRSMGSVLKNTKSTAAALVKQKVAGILVLRAPFNCSVHISQPLCSGE